MPELKMIVRVMSALAAVGMALLAYVAEWERSMAGFPDGYRGTADQLAAPLYTGITISGVALAVGFAGLALAPRRWLPPPARRRAFSLFTTVALFALTLLLVVPPILESLYPSGGG